MLVRLKRGDLVQLKSWSKEVDVVSYEKSGPVRESGSKVGTYAIVLDDVSLRPDRYKMCPVILSDTQSGWCHIDYLEKL